MKKKSFPILFTSVKFEFSKKEFSSGAVELKVTTKEESIERKDGRGMIYSHYYMISDEAMEKIARIIEDDRPKTNSEIWRFFNEVPRG